MKTLYVALLFALILMLSVCARNPSPTMTAVLGTIDGKPIDSNVFTFSRASSVGTFVQQNHRLPETSEREKLTTSDLQRQVCSKLTSAIGVAANAAELRRLGIIVTPQEIAAKSTVPKMPDFYYAHQHTVATHLAEALAAVIDRGEDPHAVYLREIQQDGMPEDGWLLELDSARNVPGSRQHMEFPSTVSAEQLKDSAVTKVGNAEALARDYKLMNEVDRIIANKDPTFRKYLAESAKVDSRGQSPGDGFWYMWQKRNEYWRGVTSKLNIWLADPTLFTTCKLADGGVMVPK